MPVRYNSSSIAPPGTFSPEKFPAQREAAIKFAREGGWWEDCMVEAPVAWGEQGENSPTLCLQIQSGALAERGIRLSVNRSKLACQVSHSMEATKELS